MLLYYLNIGSNIGHKLLNILRAMSELSFLGYIRSMSDPIESEPWGFSSSNSFINIGFALSSEIEPHDMLDEIHRIERQLGSADHRDAAGNYVDRLVDIDIMAIDDNDGNPITIHTPTLQVPHPHLHERTFFIEPYKQLRSDIYEVPAQS